MQHSAQRAHRLTDSESAESPTPLAPPLAWTVLEGDAEGGEPLLRTREEGEFVAPESYIREIARFLDAAELREVTDDLSRISQPPPLPDLKLEALELPSLHPALDPNTPVEQLAVLPPPRISVWLWLWLALTCA